MHNKPCEYKDHEGVGLLVSRGVGEMSVYNYRDVPNRISKDINMCSVCYKKHILKYYPNSRVAEYIKGE